MARLIPVAIVFILIAGAVARYKENQKQNCSNGQCKTPASPSISSKLKTPASPSPPQPSTPRSQAYQPAVPPQATSSVKSPQLTTTERARKEAFEAGKAHGTLEAMKEIERREDKAREEGKETGLIEGEAKGHETGMKLGESVGYAKAAAEEFRKGQEQGEKFGRLEGATEAREEMLDRIDETERKAEKRGVKQGYIDGFTAGKEVQRRESFYGVASVAISTASLFSALLFFVYTKREPGSVAEYRKLEKERRTLREAQITIDTQYRDWLFAQWGEQQKWLLTHDANGHSRSPNHRSNHTNRGATNGKH